MKYRILFLCTGNSSRSQMAEGWARHLKAMAEVGIDISAQRSKRVTELLSQPFDVVITVCDSAAEACPVFPGRTRLFHRSFANPPGLARDAISEDEAMSHYRRVRDEIRDFVAGLPAELGL